MRKFIKALAIILIITSIFPVKAKAAAETGINDLIENAKALDGKEVTIRGEVIGEIMDRGDYSWVNINDTTNAIGVWVSKEEADRIQYFGDYKNIGDNIQITGVFHRACREHGGEADIHGKSLQIVEKGYKVKEQISSFKVIAAIILVFAAFLVFMIYSRLSLKSVN